MVRIATGMVLAVMLAACGSARLSQPTKDAPKHQVAAALSVRDDGAVIEDVEVDGPIDVYASNVTIRRVRGSCGPYWCLRQYDEAQHLTVEDSEFAPRAPRSSADGLWVHSFIGRRLNIHDLSDGMKAWSDVRLEDSRIHRLTHGETDHSDGIQIQEGTRIVIERSAIEGGTNAAISIASSSGPVSGVTLRNNQLRGGGYTVSVRSGPYGPPERIVLERNRFGGAPEFGPISSDVVLGGAGNTMEATGRLVQVN